MSWLALGVRVQIINVLARSERDEHHEFLAFMSWAYQVNEILPV